jgi:hypothetical protein
MKKAYTITKMAVLLAAAGLVFSACGGKSGAGESAGAKAVFTGPATTDSFRGDWVKKPSSGTAAKQITVDSGFYAGNVFVFYESADGMGIMGTFIIRNRGEVMESPDGFDFQVTGIPETTAGDLDAALNRHWDTASVIVFHLSADGQTLTWNLDGSEFVRRL